MREFPFLQGLKIINQGQELAMGNFWLKPHKAEVPSNNFLMEQGKKAEKHHISKRLEGLLALILFACGRRHLCSDSEQTHISTIISRERTWLHDFSGTWWNSCFLFVCFVLFPQCIGNILTLQQEDCCIKSQMLLLYNCYIFNKSKNSKFFFTQTVKRFKVLKEVSFAYRGYIYLITNTVNYIIVLQL